MNALAVLALVADVILIVIPLVTITVRKFSRKTLTIRTGLEATPETTTTLQNFSSLAVPVQFAMVNTNATYVVVTDSISDGDVVQWRDLGQGRRSPPWLSSASTAACS